MKATILRVTLLVCAAALGQAQEPAPTPPGPTPPQPDPEQVPPTQHELGSAPDLESEMKDLFAKVELQLREIDLMLSDAAAGDVSLADVEDAGLDDLLQGAKQRTGSVVDDINRILELAEQAGGQSSSSGQQPPPDPSESPLDEPRPGQPQSREDTPSQPQPGGEEPQPQPDERPGNEKPHGDEPPPDSEPRNRDGGDPEDPNSPGSGDAKPETEQWGELPSHVQQIFRAEGSDDLPVQYRDWIDSYYRRLNRRR